MAADWDDDKEAINIARHGVSFAGFERIWDGAVFTVQDHRAHYGEPRWRAIGFLHGELVVLVYTERSGEPRPISLHPADKEDRRKYDQAMRKTRRRPTRH